MIYEPLTNKDQTEYTQNIMDKTSILGKIGVIQKNDPISKLETYEPIKIETEQLLKREKILFTINSIVIIGLIVATFHVI
jgi:hypothetical protein